MTLVDLDDRHSREALKKNLKKKKKLGLGVEISSLTRLQNESSYISKGERKCLMLHSYIYI